MAEFRNALLPVDIATMLRVLSWMEAAGIRFVIDQSPFEGCLLTPATVVEYLRDPEAFLASAHGKHGHDILYAGGELRRLAKRP